MTADFINPESYSYSLYAAPNMVTAITMLGLGLVVIVSEAAAQNVTLWEYRGAFKAMSHCPRL